MKILALLFTMIIVLWNFSATNAQEVTASSGNDFTNEQIQISWTLGEAVIQTLSSNQTTLTQGFHQSKLTITAVDEIADLTWNISAFPNPAHDYLKLDIQHDPDRKLFFSLYSMDGKLLIRKQIETQLSEISMQNYISATYFLKVTDKNLVLKTFKIIKQ